jgi:hypothetical protein
MLEKTDGRTDVSIPTSGPASGASNMGQIQYIADENNKITGVIVPIELWREIQSEKETAYLLKSAAMKKRLIDAKNRKKGIALDEACKKLGI